VDKSFVHVNKIILKKKEMLIILENHHSGDH
jgi:hypothetical protein